MSNVKGAVSAVAVLLVVAGCGAADETPDPAPDPTSAATTSAPPTPAPSTPAASTPGTSSPAASASGSPSPSGVMTLAESCSAVLDDQQAAVTALQSYVRNPLAGDVDVADLDRLRSELRAGELSAPEPLRQELNTQVGVLNEVVQGIQDGDVQRVDVDAFQGARERIATLCEDAGR